MSSCEADCRYPAICPAIVLQVRVAIRRGDGEDADINPYGAYTIEWSAASPAPAHNFDEVPTVTSPSPLYEEAAERSAS